MAMALVDQLFNVSIANATSNPTRPGFGTGLLAAYHTLFTARIRAYSSLAALVADGFTSVAHPKTYAKAVAYFSQNPAPQKLKIGRRANAPAQVQTITISTATQGEIYSVSVDGNVFTYTAPAAPTTTSVAAGLQALITAGAVTGLTSAVASGAGITLTTAANVLLNLVNLSPRVQSVANTSTDPGITADLAAIQAEDSDWYGFTLVSNGTAEQVAAATWGQANGKLFVGVTSDDAALGVATTDLGATLKTSGFDHAVALHDRAGGTMSTFAAGLLGSRMTPAPGSDTWMYKVITGQPVSAYTDTEIGYLQTKLYTFYMPLAGINQTIGGAVASGGWADEVRGADWLKSTIQIDQVQVFTSADKKVPYTDVGREMLITALRRSLKSGQDAGFLSKDVKPVITAPAVADQSASDKAARRFPGITWTAVKAGAIHSEVISGTVTY